MLELKNICVTFRSEDNFERIILNDLNLTINPGEFVMLIGENGAGKSTLFNVISGFLKPNQGQILFNHKEVTNTSQSFRSKSLAKVMQDPKLGTMENMTLYENMAFALKRGEKRSLRPISDNSRRELFREKLSLLRMGLEDRLDDVTGSLSGGQRQALSLVMAILSDSQILLLDEITGALDPKMAETVMNLSDQIIRQEKKAALMITHNMAHAIAYGDRIVVLKDGRIAKEFVDLEKKSLTPKDLHDITSSILI